MGKKTGPNPTDRAKAGTKRSLLTEGHGLPIGVVIAGANVNDYKLTEATLASIPIERPDSREADAAGARHPQGLCRDADHFREQIYELVEAWGYTAHIRPVGSGQSKQMTEHEKAAAALRARRWVVERTHSWLNRFRGLLIRWCKRLQNHLALLHFACALIVYRAVAHWDRL